MTNKEYWELKDQAKALYERAKANGLCDLDRWGQGVAHHPKSVELMRFLEEHDFNDMDDYFCWKVGGDGDNGEILMYEMDAYFEQKDKDDG